LHKYLNDYTQIGEYFNALDLYIVSSREEGGPKAVLESMASGIPLVTTRVGQAMDLVKHGENGWMVEPEDVQGLAHWAKFVIDNRSSVEDVLMRGKFTAEENSYPSQIPLWREFMTGFVEISDT
jgi:glycosyltransferase involved in cell wall biosynthesis